MARRQIVALVALASVLATGCSGGDGGPPTGWSSRSIAATFGRRAVVVGVVESRTGFVALGLRSAPPPTSSLASPGAPEPPSGVPRIWTSTDAVHWSSVRLHGLPRHVRCERCGPSQLASRGRTHVLTWWDGGQYVLYRSRDLSHWARVYGPVRDAQYGAAAVVRGNFVASFRVGGAEGPWTYRGATSRDGRAWTPLPTPAAPGMVGLVPRARLRDRLLSLAIPAINREQVMTSTDGRSWSPAGGAPGFIERGPVASADHRRVGAQAYDEGEANARGRFVISSDGRTWHDVMTFARRFPHADLARVGRVGRWWIVGGVDDDRLPQRQRRWSAWVTRDLRHWRPWTNHGRVGEYDHYYPVAAHGIAFFLGGYQRLVLFNPSA